MKEVERPSDASLRQGVAAGIGSFDGVRIGGMLHRNSPMDEVKTAPAAMADLPEHDAAAHGRRVTAALDELSRLIGHDACGSAVGLMLTRLIERFDEHFAAEDYLLVSGTCPQTVQHWEEHTRMMQHLTALVHDYDRGDRGTLEKDLECLSLMYSRHLHNCRICALGPRRPPSCPF